jgi:hypothetical protein
MKDPTSAFPRVSGYIKIVIDSFNGKLSTYAYI